MTAGRTSVSSGSPYEPRFGFSRAVKTGRVIAIAGTAPLDADGRTTGTGDVEVQARRCFQIIESALKQLGASLSDITRSFYAGLEWEPVRGVVFLGGINWRQVHDYPAEFVPGPTELPLGTSIPSGERFEHGWFFGLSFRLGFVGTRTVSLL